MYENCNDNRSNTVAVNKTKIDLYVSERSSMIIFLLRYLLYYVRPLEQSSSKVTHMSDA